MMCALLNIAVSLTFSTNTVYESDLCKQIADITDLNKKEIVSEIQSEYCINNVPSALSAGLATDDDGLIKDMNTYVLLK